MSAAEGGGSPAAGQNGVTSGHKNGGGGRQRAAGEMEIGAVCSVMLLRCVPVKCTHTPQAVSTAADRFSKKQRRMQPRCKAAASRHRQQAALL